MVAALLWFDFANSRAAEGAVEHTYQVLNASEVLFATIQDADSRQRGYLLTGEPQYLTRYRELAAAEPPAMKALGALTSDNPAQQKRRAELERLVKARFANLDEAIAARRDAGLDAAVAVLRAGEDKHVMRDIRASLAALEAEEHRLLRLRTEAAAVEAARIRSVLAMGGVLLIALLICAGMIIESDIGKLQVSEIALRRQADLLDNTPGPIVVWELGGRIEYWNHGAEKLYGVSREQALGQVHNDLLRPEHPLGMPAVQELLARDGEWHGELKHIIDGREIIVETQMTLLAGPDGHTTVLKANRDITQEKRAQEAVRRLNLELEQRVQDRTAQLEASNQELEAFAYSVSHDLRAPLRGIDGWSLALIEDYGATLDQTANLYLQRVRGEAQRMGHLIDGLLRLSQLTRIGMQHEPVDLTALARSIAGRLREANAGRGLEFIIQEGLSTSGDAHLLEIVLSNLLNNAVKFTGTRPQARIEFGRTCQAGQSAFYVRDNGVGFDMAYAHMLFGAFQRLHKYTEFPGNGIGLATAQRVLRRHGGSIWPDARLDAGATFYFTVEADADQPSNTVQKEG
jgi:PAS domain S-box-containing protein